MRHNVIAVCLLFAASFCNSASAGIMLTLDDLPGSYTPGEDFSFQVRLEGVTGLNSFFIELRIRADGGTPDVDFSLNTTLTGAPSSGYVFGDHDSFGFEAGSVVLGNDLIVSLSDFLTSDDEVDVISGVNDIVATVFISTTRNVGNLRIEFDTEFLELLDAEFLPVPGFDELELSPFAVVAAPTQTAVIPEPRSGLLWLIAFLSMLAVGRRRWLAPFEVSHLGKQHPPH
jgi:hypothetical protein